MPPAAPLGHRRDIIANALTGIFRRHAAGWAVASLVLTMAGSTALVVLYITVPDSLRDQRSGLLEMACTLLPYGLVGSVLVARRPDLPFGWLLSGAAAALVVVLVTFVPAFSAARKGDWSAWVAWGLSASALGFLPIGVQGLVNVRFPSGRPASRAGRWLERLLVAGLVTVVVGGFLGGDVRQLLPDADPTRMRRPVIGGTWVETVGSAMIVAAPLVVLLGLVAGIGVIVRFWQASGIERQQLKWRAAGVASALVLFPFAVTERLGPVVDNLDSTVFVATLAIPVLRYRLWAIDTIVRRSAVYAGATAVLVGGYVAIIALSARLVSERVGASVAAIGVALAFVPVRTVSQRFVDRVFYGQRSDPYRALSEVGRRLELAGGPTAVLSVVVGTVAQSLRLPYVAIERPGDSSVLAAHGSASTPGCERVRRWPLTYRGTPVGQLAAEPRRGEAAFDERDCDVLADLARQAGPAVRAEALTADLLDSRQRLVTAREEERRRLRRDLHDGLGPMLTGLGLSLDAARARLADAERTAHPDQLARVDELLVRSKEVASQVISDLRGMVYDLRPPALDDLGLVGAVRLHAERVAASAGLEVDVVADAVPRLPAAVEVATFRTAVEAITNAVRHSGAKRCDVRITASPGNDLVLDVRDDGSSGPWLAGVGLTAMRERAEELGGSFSAGPTSTGGQVLARYPLSTGER